MTFDAWIAAEFGGRGPFTLLVVVVAIGGLSITPIRSSWFHVIGTDLEWADVARLLDGGGPEWDAAVFAPRADAAGGPLGEAAARIAVKDLGEEILADRTVLNREHFFDRKGRRMKVEEVPAQ
ncbi:hypothetical protein [Amaricoccus sp.]|uniref:hypothetical protein n=1 Tax=Amaricoccus sp. TaxID=1872485 RepID=UPI0026292A45|nr:hypothetical protein [Amaricoccus sp.]HRO12610.1 hypothetical protein [Amaricoccus sp.]